MTVYDAPIVTVLACDALFCLISIPLILRRVPPNPIYGYRTRATLGNPSIWYAANSHFGARFLAANVIVLPVYLLFTRLASPSPGVLVFVSVLALGLPVLLAGISTSRLVRRLARTAAERR